MAHSKDLHLPVDGLKWPMWTWERIRRTLSFRRSFVEANELRRRIIRPRQYVNQLSVMLQESGQLNRNTRYHYLGR